MSFEIEKREARRMLAALEDGTLDAYDTRALYEDADPALVHLVLAWLRARYGPGHPASDAVLGRMVALMREAPAVAARAKRGESDAIVQWFEESHDYRELDRDDFVDLVIDKLEG